MSVQMSSRGLAASANAGMLASGCAIACTSPGAHTNPVTRASAPEAAAYLPRVVSSVYTVVRSTRDGESCGRAEDANERTGTQEVLEISEAMEASTRAVVRVAMSP